MPLHKCVLQCRDSLPKGVLRSSRVRMRTVRVFSLSYSTDLPPGYGRGLSHSPNITSHVHNQSPNILLPTGRVERKLILGPNVGFHTLVAHRWSWGFGETQASVFAQRALPGRGVGSYENATRVAGPRQFWATAAVHSSRSPFISSEAHFKASPPCCCLRELSVGIHIPDPARNKNGLIH